MTTIGEFSIFHEKNVKKRKHNVIWVKVINLENGYLELISKSQSQISLEEGFRVGRCWAGWGWDLSGCGGIVGLGGVWA